MAKTDKPNILILWGDDIGIWNISHFSRGMMGYRTPNIDRIAKEGVTFTDYYSQQSCTAGRACFITGQNPIRTGLTKVGMPGATVGLQKEDPTIAELLKPLGYATGQFGKNHLGDRDEYLPTVHGFDEFFGNLYHLNAEEEPELPDYPKDPRFKKQFGPRGVLSCKADGKGGQTIEDTGPLTKKRMETIDEEITDRAIAWMEKQAKANQPFFLWYNATAMHFRTHVAQKNLGKSGQDPYSDRMVVHDEQIGKILDKLDELGIADNTIVMYSTDNGPENDTWPDGATTPFRGQKDTNWEGGWRVPCFMRWPGKIKPDSVLNGIVSHIDMFPTLLAAAGNPDVTKQLLEGCTVGGKKFNVHLDGYNMIPYLTGQVKETPRPAIMYFSDDGEVIAVRVGDWKFNLAVQRANTMRLWAEPFVKLRVPYIMSMRRDPFETRRIQLEHLLGLDGRSCASDVFDAGLCGGADRSRSPSSRLGRNPLRSIWTRCWRRCPVTERADSPSTDLTATRSAYGGSSLRRPMEPTHAGDHSLHGLLSYTSGIVKNHESRSADAASVGEDVRAFYERHPYPPPVDSLEKYRQPRAGPAETPRGLSPLLARKPLSGGSIHPHCRLRNLSGGQACLALACGSGYRHRLQRNQCALYRGAQAEIQPEQSPGPPASHRAGQRLGNELRSNHLHRGSPSSRGARCGAQRSARCAQSGRRSDASHGVCALRTDWHLHAAGILQTDRHPCRR